MMIKNEQQKCFKKAKKLYYGKVVADKNDKTITVLITRQKKYPIYNKQLTVSKKYHLHDENNVAKNGDIVAFVSSRPYSRSKRWRLVKVVKTSKEAEAS